jgi:hypothetical protein
MKFIISEQSNGLETWIRFSEIDAMEEIDTEDVITTRITLKSGAIITIEESIQVIVSTISTLDEEAIGGIVISNY